jgi:imidazolonepropionase-like amidohydrolase
LAAETLVLRNGIALAGERLEEREFGSLVITGGVIEEITPPGSAPPAGRQVDLAGRYVMPGLIDAHVHFDLVAGIKPYAHWDEHPLRRSLGLARNGLTALRYGITTVRDLGCADDTVIEYARLTAAGQLLGPAVIAAGRWVCMTGGHGWEYGRQADGEAEVRKAVREQIRAGAGVIKLMATGGLSTPGSPHAAELTVAELSAGVDEAHKAGLRVAAHAHAAAGIRAALAAGTDSIEHGAFLGDAELADMRRRDTFLVPTVVAVENVRPGSGIDPDVVRKTEAAREVFQASIASAIAAGVRIAAGTDAGTALNPVGPSLLGEIGLYARLGASNTDALLAATVTAGQLVGDGRGIIEPGHPADLLVLPRSPVADLGVLREISAVIARGRLLAAAELDTAAAALPGGPVRSVSSVEVMVP